MPRIIVITDTFPPSNDASVWLDEDVQSVHLSTEHAAAQFVERLAWAISDAEDADAKDADGGAASDRHVRPGRRRRGSGLVTRSRDQVRARV